MRIVSIERDVYGCNYYRIHLPLHKLKQHGMAQVDHLEDDASLLTDYSLKKIMAADLLVFHRPSSDEWFKFIKVAQKHGKIIVVDYDDDPFNTSPWNEYYKHIGTKEQIWKDPDTGEESYLWKDGMFGFSIDRNIERRDMFRACFRHADLLTTTNDNLRDYFKEINNNCITLPNFIDFDFYPRCELVKKEVRIGWQGGAAHYEDLYMIRGAIAKILKKYPSVKFVYIGDCKLKKLFKDFPKDQFEEHTWVTHYIYPYKLKFLNLDIGLCPLVDNEFNIRKSSIKHYEYSVVEAATIASRIAPYSNDIIDGETGLLVDEDQWFEAMDDLVSNAFLRKKLSEQAYENIYENYNIDKKIHMWRDAYESLLKKELNPDELCV